MSTYAELVATLLSVLFAIRQIFLVEKLAMLDAIGRNATNCGSGIRQIHAVRKGFRAVVHTYHHCWAELEMTMLDSDIH